MGRGGSQTFTITPNAGYRINQVLVQGVNDPAAVTSGTYTFTNVQANRTIAASFTQSQATITSSAGAGGSIARPARRRWRSAVTRRTRSRRTTGTHRRRPRGRREQRRRRPGRHVHVHQRDGEPHDRGDVCANPPAAINVTAPTGGGSYNQDSLLRVSWSASPAVAMGEFTVFVENNGTLYLGYSVPASISNLYSQDVKLTVPVASGYQVLVAWRPTPGVGSWTVFGFGTGGTFSVIPAGPPPAPITVSAPAGGGGFRQNTVMTVSWTVSPAVATGEYTVFLENGGSVYLGYTQPADVTQTRVLSGHRARCARRDRIPGVGSVAGIAGRALDGVRLQHRAIQYHALMRELNRLMCGGQHE